MSQLRGAIENYRMVSVWCFDRVSVADIIHKRKGFNSEQLNEVIFSKEKAKDKEFWQEISASFHDHSPGFS